jgi:hypothetical protein
MYNYPVVQSELCECWAGKLMCLLIVVWDDVPTSYAAMVLNVLELGCVRVTTNRYATSFRVVCIPPWYYLLHPATLERLLRNAEAPRM